MSSADRSSEDDEAIAALRLKAIVLEGSVLESIVEEMRRVLIPLGLPVPPQLEEVLGYKGRSRWVAFFWTKRGSELLADDGYFSDACAKTAWSAYTEHPTVNPALKNFHFGGGGRVAEVYLLLDRRERRLYAGAILPVVRLLAAQHPGPPSVEEREARWSRTLHLMSREASMPYPPQTIRAWKEDQLRAETEMREWLDQHKQPEEK
jgi:hypothetical protein